jgi:hypothetical protein
MDEFVKQRLEASARRMRLLAGAPRQPLILMAVSPLAGVNPVGNICLQDIIDQ